MEQKSIDNDVRRSLADSWAMQPTCGQKLAWPMEDAVFKHWFEMKNSGVLVVDGVQRNADTVSPTTYFSAILNRNLIDPQLAVQHVPLMFFCGMHAEPGDSLEGASGIIRSLNYQLLGQNPDSDNLFLDNTFVDQAYLCGLFRQLVMTAKPTTIFCVIDGLSSGTNADGSIVNTIFRDLQLLAKDTKRYKPGVEFKLLITGPEACRLGEEWFPDADCIVIPKKTWR